ncbi:MAG: hypothetical protein ACYDGR_00775 [Candidatus Dormibacteria bacterium]
MKRRKLLLATAVLGVLGAATVGGVSAHVISVPWTTAKAVVAYRLPIDALRYE